MWSSLWFPTSEWRCCPYRRRSRERHERGRRASRPDALRSGLCRARLSLEDADHRASSAAAGERRARSRVARGRRTSRCRCRHSPRRVSRGGSGTPSRGARQRGAREDGSRCDERAGLHRTSQAAALRHRRGASAPGVLRSCRGGRRGRDGGHRVRSRPSKGRARRCDETAGGRAA